MYKGTTISIEGTGSSRALDELLAIPGIESVRHTPPPKVVYRDPGLLSAVGEIVGIAGGVAGLVSAVIEWREKWLKGRGGSRLDAVIEDSHGNRLLLRSATPEQLTQVLESIAAERTQ